MRWIVAIVLITVTNANLAPLFQHEDKVNGQYIVVLKHNGNLANVTNWAKTDLKIQLQREFQTILKGFQADIPEVATLRKIRQHNDVLYVEENAVIRALEVANTWGQDRVNQRYLPLDGDADFNGTGEGVNAYVFDTGIYTENIYFQGRASVIYDAFDENGIDCNGHGTHCAGTIGSYQFGIARQVNLFGLRVLDCYGLGTLDGIMRAMDYLVYNYVKPAVASMSLALNGVSPAFDDAIREMVSRGIFVSVAAGNDNSNACNYSPARVNEAITVGATELVTNGNDNFDKRATEFSNYGSCVDIFAPGVDVLSTWIGSPSATHSLDGTSMACPHVTGAACVLLGKYPTLTPKQVKQRLIDDATTDVIREEGYGSPNRFLFVGYTDNGQTLLVGSWSLVSIFAVMVVRFSQ